MKKILILGGGNLSCDIVRQAKEMGLYTIVTDWNDVNVSPAKQIADEHYQISITDYEALEDLICKNKINGIITGFADSYLIPYAEICRRSSLPCYGTVDQFRSTLDKAFFKNICRKHSIDVVPEYSVDAIRMRGDLPAKSVILKPIDNSGSRGINKVDSFKEFENGLENTLAFSQKKTVLVEKYMDCDDISLCYTICDGEITLSAICDRYLYKTSHFGSVTSGLIYPSKYLNFYVENIDKKVQHMLEDLGIRNGVLFMQAFVENNKCYFYEMGYRLSGGRHYIFTENQNKISGLKQLLNFAVGGRMSYLSSMQKDDPCFKKICSQLSILCESGKIESISGIDYLEKNENIIDYSLSYNSGDIVGKQGTTQQIVARIHIVVDKIDDLMEIMNGIKKHFIILNSKGKNMILDFFTFDPKSYK